MDYDNIQAYLEHMMTETQQIHCESMPIRHPRNSLFEHESSEALDNDLLIEDDQDNLVEFLGALKRFVAKRKGSSKPPKRSDSLFHHDNKPIRTTLGAKTLRQNIAKREAQSKRGTARRAVMKTGKMAPVFKAEIERKKRERKQELHKRIIKREARAKETNARRAIMKTGKMKPSFDAAIKERKAEMDRARAERERASAQRRESSEQKAAKLRQKLRGVQSKIAKSRFARRR